MVFDEIQVHSDLKESLVLFNKTFECRFACTGSALWIEETEGTRPSPDFEYFKINPFSFSEFVSIIDPTQYENYCLEKELFFSNKTALEGKHNKSLYKLLREYIAVGGMPQVVSCYKNNYKNSNVYEMVHKCKRDKIIKVYEADLKKYDKLKNLKLSETYLNVIQNYGRIIDISEDNFTNFRKLEETNIVIFSLHIQNFNEKLNGSVDLYRIKPFLLDVGILFYYICGTENDNVARKLYKDFVLNKDGDDNGFLYENFVASTLNINKFGCFFKTFMDASEEDPNIQKQHEIDFVYSGINGIVALEAKSGGNKNCHSLLKGLLKYSKIKEGYILCKSYCFINTKGGQGPFYIPFYSLDFYK